MPPARHATGRLPLKVLPILISGALLFFTVAYACEWNYSIWAIRTDTADPLFRIERDGKVGYINAKGKIVIPPTLPYGSNFSGEFHEGLLCVREKHQSRWRFINTSGATVLRPSVDLVYDFSEGLAPAAAGGRFDHWGYIDRSGTFVIPPQYSWASEFSNGLARVATKGQFNSTGYIDKQGQFVVPPNLAFGSDFHEDRATVILGGPCRIVNGGSCARARFVPIQPDASYDCRYSIIDRTGHPVSNLHFDDAMEFSEGFAPILIGAQWGYADRSGAIAIVPQFEAAKRFSGGTAPVQLNGKFGFIDREGKFIIEPQFQAAEPFYDDRALVSELNNEKHWISHFINRRGEPAFPGSFIDASSFRHGLALVAYRTAGRKHVAWIDVAGREVFRFAQTDVSQ